MDFFEYQAEAKKRTRLLVFYYALAVALIVAAVYLVLAVGLVLNEAGEQEPPDFSRLWRPGLMLWTAVFVGGVIGLGTLFKTASLSAGGKSVARMMGGRPVAAETNQPQERRLLNIVEEMAIASGVPAPPVYVIEEPGINAFAAGFNPSDAVIGVTRGSMEKLNRDELQGVIAHEFSHIINGDMRLNIRLIGILFGILLLAVLGTWIMRMGFYSGLGRRRSTRSGGKGGGGAMAILVFGLLLIAIGYIGVFFGRLIKSAISRQREFLSDASAVQFTRNPAGIGGALKKIGELSSRIESVHAEEASHMFFANSLKSSLGGLLATHPPLEERIRRIDHDLLREGTVREKSPPPRPKSTAPRAAAPLSGFAGAANAAADPGLVTTRVGTMNPESLEYAAHLVQSIPGSLRSAAHTVHGARAIVFCLLFSREKGAAEKQRKHLQEHLQEPTRGAVGKLRRPIRELPVTARMPLVELALPALQQQKKDEYQRFKKTVESLIAADNKVSIFEFTLSRNLIRHLEPVFGKPEKIPVSYHSVKPLLPRCLPLLAILARYGNEEDPRQAAGDFAAGLAHLGGDPDKTPMPETGGDPVKTFAETLDMLRRADGKVKKQLLNACVAAVLGNRKVTLQEAELLRAVADSLDCPLPPVMVSA